MKYNFKNLVIIILHTVISSYLYSEDLSHYFWEIPKDEKWDSTRKIINKIKTNDEFWLREYVSTDFEDIIHHHPQLIASIYLFSISKNPREEHDIIDIIFRSKMAPKTAFNLLFRSINPQVLQRINYLNVLWLANNLDKIGGFTELSNEGDSAYSQIWNDIYNYTRLTSRIIGGKDDSDFPFDDYTLLELGKLLYNHAITNSMLNDNNGQLLANSFGFVVSESNYLKQYFGNLFLESLNSEFRSRYVNTLKKDEIINSATAKKFVLFLRPYRIDQIPIGLNEVINFLGLSSTLMIQI